MSEPKHISQVLNEAKQAFDRGAKVRAAMEASPTFRKFIESGSDKRVALLISMAYLMASVYNAYFEEAVSIMEEYGLVHKKIKTTSNNLTQSFDAFDKVISALINTQDAKVQLCTDYEIFKATCDQFMNADQRVDDAGIATTEQTSTEPNNPEPMKKPNPNATRKVIAYETDGCKTYSCAKEAAEHYGIRIQSLYALINNGKEIEGGVSFDYLKWEE